MRVMYGPQQGTTSAARQETSSRSGSGYTAVAYDTASVPAETVSVDVLTEDIEQFRRLIRSGVLLAQSGPATASRPVLRARRRHGEGHRKARRDGRLHLHVRHRAHRAAGHDRPADARPGWSYDHVVAQFGTYDAVAATFATYASLATNGQVT
ncbi:hypothetical protein D3C59_34895 [Streptomyces sp. SHP22-7]|nr:hypothetical protein D3C59_34895 [Streptomyces sp. SHP22-7]